MAISIMIAVDVEGALSSGNLGGNLYMVDTTGYLGKLGEGTDELTTTCNNLSVINWTVYPIDPNTTVSISSFSGQIITTKVCVPTEIPANPVYWQGTVQTQGATGTYQYNMTLNFEGRLMTFDPYLNVVAS